MPQTKQHATWQNANARPLHLLILRKRNFRLRAEGAHSAEVHRDTEGGEKTTSG